MRTADSWGPPLVQPDPPEPEPKDMAPGKALRLLGAWQARDWFGIPRWARAHPMMAGFRTERLAALRLHGSVARCPECWEPYDKDHVLRALAWTLDDDSETGWSVHVACRGTGCPDYARPQCYEWDKET